MELTVKSIAETTLINDKGQETKYTVTMMSKDKIKVVVKQDGSCSYQKGDRLELKKLESQTSLRPIKD